MKIISTPMDFLGLNIYTANLVKTDKTKGSPGYKIISLPKNWPVQDMVWVIPECIYYCLKYINDRYKIKKFYITENGCVVKDKISLDGKVHDKERIDYLKKHIISAHKAVSEGINLNGYFIWTLIDNFEWAWGTSKRLGLIYVDFPTQKRIIKDSGYWYKKVIQNNGIY
jgi:beta-glucosidase